MRGGEERVRDPPLEFQKFDSEDRKKGLSLFLFPDHDELKTLWGMLPQKKNMRGIRILIGDTRKLQDTKGLLLSEPVNIIKHIPITETAYNEAWEKLLARYDKKNQIIFSLIKTFMEQPSFNDSNSSNLRNIADTSDEVIRGLKSIDTKAESRDVWFIYILLQKADPKRAKNGRNSQIILIFPHLKHL
ncbi:uncharacterized protein TNCV_4850291 [Trichonephila clavipes]|nr:uncharacterized protein TNCV_4850291 [Trichonephila clavipes]